MDKKERRIIALKSPWRPTTQKLAHDQSQVERCHVYRQTLENIRVMPQMHASHSARFIAVRKAPLHLLAPQPQPSLPPFAPNPSPVGVHRRLFGLLPLPVPPVNRQKILGTRGACIRFVLVPATF